MVLHLYRWWRCKRSAGRLQSGVGVGPLLLLPLSVPMSYLPRIVDHQLEARLRVAGAIVLEGPKACGKTATARQRAASEVLLDVDRDARLALGVDPTLVLVGDTPRLIDEWQTAPEIWNHIRRAVDDRGEPGQFILTGSAVPTDDTTRHTGAGRISRLRMRPFSLYELEESSGEFSLEAALSGEQIEPAKVEQAPLEEIVELVARGGWPGLRTRGLGAALQGVRDYVDEVVRTDIHRVDGIERDPIRVERFLQSVARNVATNVSMATLARDAVGEDGSVRPNTALEYADSLARLMILEDQPAWRPHLRSKSRLRQAPKRHFVDPSLAVAALRASVDQLLQDLEFFGLLFESMVVRDLRVYADHADAQVLHYRDNTDLEVDAVVVARSGAWCAFEVKLGGEQLVEAGAATLTRFRERVDTARSGEPSATAIITAMGEYCYQRDDGIWVVPIRSLGP